jgi:hypothetical protein
VINCDHDLSYLHEYLSCLTPMGHTFCSSDKQFIYAIIHLLLLIANHRKVFNWCWTSSPPRMWGGELRRRQRMQRVRCLSGSSGRGEEEMKRGERRPRSWAPRSRNPCFSPRPPSWHPQERSREWIAFLCLSLVLFFCQRSLSLVRLLFFLGQA